MEQEEENARQTLHQKYYFKRSHKNRISGSGVLEISISSVQEDIMEERKTYEEAESIVTDLH
jgi:hypothetical protein